MHVKTVRIVPKFVDVSHHNVGALPNGDIDFVALKAGGIDGVVIKATQGTRFRDKVYPRWRDQARDAGLRVGTYHFGDAGSSPEDQADFYLGYAQPADDEACWLDLEPDTTTKKDMTLAMAQAFCEAVDAATGRRCGLYSGPTIKEKLIGPSEFWSSRRLWLAHYNTNIKWPDAWPYVWGHQYTDGTGGPEPRTVPGFKRGTNIDINSYLGTDEEFEAEWAGAAIG